MTNNYKPYKARNTRTFFSLYLSVKLDHTMSSLNWISFHAYLASSLRDDFTSNKFADVTLVCDEQKQFQAHKFVLSSFSPILKNLLVTNPHPHPIIYLRGIRQQELESILQFMYLGCRDFGV